MMIDLGKFKALLSSLVPVSGTHYQIWGNDKKMIFSTEGVISKELHVKEYQNLSNRITDQNGFQYSGHDGDNFLCGIPLRNNQGVVGALIAYARKPYRSFRYEAGNNTEADHPEEMERFLSNLIRLVEENLAAKEEAEELAQELDQSFEDLYLYGKISTQIKTLKFSDDMLKTLLGELLENMRVDATFAFLPEKVEYNFQVMKPHICNKFSAPESCLDNMIHMIPPDTSLLNENYFIINSSIENAQYKSLAMDPYRFLAVKVQHGEVLYGWLGLVSFNLNEIFRQGELRLVISLAEQLAGVIANTDLYENLEQFIINMVKSLVFAIEAKDIYTRGHSERVSKYSLLMGERLGLGKKEYSDLKWASILHDIGKIGIPESILNKPARLTDAEYDIIKKHPVKGCEILQPIEQLADSLPGIIHHHERYDGKGYPQGLKGEEIPLIARIIAVADTFDAINSTRAYRGTRSPEKALEIIEEVAGSQLDSRIIDVFKKVYEKDLRFQKEEKRCPTVQNTMTLKKSVAI
jgi:HD-GYP domain-containing protein (c-di-GMP phosphodiesterase class II)